MIQITYNNNTIKSIGRTTDVEIVPDDRQEIVKTIGGVVVEDYGVIANGEIISLSAVFSENDYNNTLLNYWSNRTKVTVTLDDGTIINNARIVIRRTQFANEVLNQYKKVYLEVWKV